MDISNSVRAGMCLARLRLDQWKSREELELLQGRALKGLVAHAKAHVPYYRKTLRGVDVRSLADVAKIPFIKKADVQAAPELFRSSAFSPSSLSRHRTSGSSGRPLTVLYSPEDSARAAAQRLHWYMENGVGPLDVQANLTYYSCEKNYLQSLGLFRVSYLRASDPEEKNLSALASLRPGSVSSSPSFIAPLATANNDAGNPVSVRTVFTVGEVLTPGARELVSKSFSCAISDRYGAIETGPIAWECEKGSMHVFSDSIIAEILDEAGEPVREGEVGDIVLTALHKRSMPFIRYRIGDRAAFGRKCSCGRGLHVITELQGRSNAVLVLPSGRGFCSTMVGAALRHLRGIACFKTVQERDGRLRVMVVQAGILPLSRGEVAETVQAALPERMEIEVEFADRIEPGPGRKVCDFISKARQAGRR